MIVPVTHPVEQTTIFIVVLIIALAVSVRRRTEIGELTPRTTTELKGLAILGVIFAHVGYQLVSDDRFMFPLSIAGGILLNVFLFVSGYGLTMSTLTKQLTTRQFYWRRLSKMVIPVWLTLGIFFILDYLLLHHSYSMGTIIQSFLGLFPRADINLDINSPLWFITFILAYYALFPLVFLRKRAWLSALALFAIFYTAIQLEPKYFTEVLHLYRTHTVAFPLGMVVAWLVARYQPKQLVQKWVSQRQLPKNVVRAVYISLLITLTIIAAYTTYHSGVNDAPWWEQLTSLFTMSVVISLFTLKNFEIRLLSVFGVVSFEIYLLHWPLMSRYPFGFQATWFMMACYLAAMLGLGWLLQQASAAARKYIS